MKTIIAKFRPSFGNGWNKQIINHLISAKKKKTARPIANPILIKETS
jgi:hypothetical protein